MFDWSAPVVCLESDWRSCSYAECVSHPLEEGSIIERYPYDPEQPRGRRYRVFVSHAGEQKPGFVAFLLEKFEREYPALKGQVFVDERSLAVGGEALETIYTALQDACVGEEQLVVCRLASCADGVGSVGGALRPLLLSCKGGDTQLHATSSKTFAVADASWGFLSGRLLQVATTACVRIGICRCCCAAVARQL
jgi:hypothetical protein